MSTHGRINSTDERRRVAIPRRSTKGPLDVDDDPLGAPSPSQNAPPPDRVRSPASRPSASPAPRSPRLRSPVSRPTTETPAALKDFSFLQDPSAYHVLPAASIPPPFLNAPNIPSVASPIDSLLLSGHYRLAAIAAARNLVSTPPTDYTTLFHLLHIRLACLCLINEHALAAQEAKVFGDLNSAFYYAEEGRGQHLVPWELRVLVVRLAALGYGEWRKGIMGYYELARECRKNYAKAETDAEKDTWNTRLRDCGIRVANVLVEMGDLEGAGRHLASLGAGAATSGEEDDEKTTQYQREIKLMETLVWLRLGDIAAARRCLAPLLPSDTDSIPDSKDDDSALLPATLTALLQLAQPSYPTALTSFQHLHTQHPKNPMITQNLAVCLLYTGRIAEARALLENLARDTESPPFHALIFNLCTIFELCTERNREGKVGLARDVAARRGDGRVGWEWGVGDFKL